MNFNLLLLYPCILLFITFYRSKVQKRGQFCESFISRDQTSLLQGIFCVCVILHHLTQAVTGYGAINKGPITIFSSMGILFTSVFFFLSGYGLIYSVLNKKDYLNGFLLHRLPLILVPFFMANIIYVLVRIFYTKIPTSFPDIIKCITGFLLINGNGWFIVEIFYLYLAFYIIFRLVKNKDLAIFLLSIVTIIIIYIGFNSGHDYSTIGYHWFKGEWWFNSTVGFILGLYFARYREIIFTFFKKYYVVILPLVVLLFILAFRIEERVLNKYGYYAESFLIDKVNNKFVTLISQSIVCLIFDLLVVLVTMKVTIGNKILSFLALISTELFLIHNLFIKSIFDFNKMNDFSQFALVFLCSIISAFVIHSIDAPIISFIQRLCKGKSYIKDCEEDLFRLRREKNAKKIKTVSIIVLVAIFAITGITTVFHNVIKLPMEYNEELKVLKNAKASDVIRFGRFDTDYYMPGDERVEWIVLYRSKNDIMMVSKEGLSSLYYNQKHADTTWKESDICGFINNTLYDQLFSNDEKNCIIPNPDTNDLLSLLSAKEASLYFTDDLSRQVKASSSAERNGANVNALSKVNQWDVKGYRSSWWWLRGDETPSIFAPIVTVDGEIIEDEKYVNKPNGVIRPVVWIHVPESE